MDFQHYRDLCREASIELGLPDAERLANEGLLEKDGLSASLFHDEEVVPDRLFCYVDLGPVPNEQRSQVMERLLMLNLLSGSKTDGVHALDPASGNALFCIHLMHPERLQGKQLAALLQAYLDRARLLRDSMLHEANDLSFMDAARQVYALEESICLHELA